VTARAQPLALVASVTQRLAVLLAAGVAPASAWGYVAEGSSASVPGIVAGRVDIPVAIVEASHSLRDLEAGAWRGLAAAWSVATEAGAPLAPSLRNYAASLRALAQAQREVAVALAAPVATTRMVMALPVVGILFGMVLGFDTLRTLFATVPGWACLVIGSALMGIAARWNRRLVAKAQPADAAPGLEFELMAIAASGGSSLDRAIEMLSAAIERFELARDVGRVDEVLELSRRAGVPAAELLRSEAEEMRRVAAADAQERAAALSVSLMLPLGLCVLPAFMVLGVVPLLVAVISSTVESF
jgi:tight adherence protein B